MFFQKIFRKSNILFLLILVSSCTIAFLIIYSAVYLSNRGVGQTKSHADSETPTPTP